MHSVLTEEQFNKLKQLRPDISLNHKDSDIADFVYGIKSMIDMVGDDPSRDGLIETPFRVLKAFLEYTKGYGEDPTEILGKSFDVTYDELILIKDIPFNSMCEHHFAPFFGKAHIAYIPQENVITGLSKFARLTDAFAHRFQVQERLTAQIADTIEEVLKPLGVAVIIEAEHYCMCGRGVKKQGASTTTSSVRGVFREKPEARAEVMTLIKS
ncbi:GTP cyclohydrolase 1 [compost metagenome]